MLEMLGIHTDDRSVAMAQIFEIKFGVIPVPQFPP